MIRVAIYYLPNGREIDVFKGVKNGFTARDACLNESVGFREFPTWEIVCERFNDEEPEVDLESTDYANEE